MKVGQRYLREHKRRGEEWIRMASEGEKTSGRTLGSNPRMCTRVRERAVHVVVSMWQMIASLRVQMAGRRISQTVFSKPCFCPQRPIRNLTKQYSSSSIEWTDLGKLNQKCWKLSRSFLMFFRSEKLNRNFISNWMFQHLILILFASFHQ